MASGRVPNTISGAILWVKLAFRSGGGTRGQGGWLEFCVAAQTEFRIPSAGRRVNYLSSDRREFFKRVGATVAVAYGVAPAGALADPGQSADSLLPGKDPRLVVHAAAPAVLETPLDLLAKDRITPIDALFVRNVQHSAALLTIKPPSLTGWKIELAGLVDRPQIINASLLEDLEQVAVEMVLQCSGNGRSLFSAAAKTKGTAWGRGGMGNVRFSGVRLQTVLDHFGIEPKSEARYLSAEGVDDPAAGEQDFEHSLPLADALKKSVLALRINGEPIPAVHGGPVRLVTGGYYGTMHVKWISRLRFDAEESNHTSQVPHYRTPLIPIAPGEAFDATLANSESNWRMKIKSVVLSPLPGAKLNIGEVSTSGVAFNDGEAAIETVLVSGDAGRTWQKAEVEAPDSPYAWYRWQARLNLPAGRQQIWARAIDKLGRTQPLDGAIHWNPNGYTWNGVDKIDVTVA
jgi:sulfite oxidase